MARRSLTHQSLHYFSRPHAGLPQGPVGGASAWTRHTLKAWQQPFDDADPEALRHQLMHGTGFVLLKGAPVDEEATIAFGARLGTPGAQNDAGDMLGHVRDEGFDHQRDVRAYRTRTRINFHCDAADVVGLLCVSQGASGGGSRLASSVTVHDEVLRRRPDLHPLLFQPFALDTKSEGGLRWFPVEPCRWDGSTLRTFWHADYFRSVERHDDAPRLTDAQHHLLELVDAICEETCIEMDLQPGDLQLVNNHRILHGRAAFTDDGQHQRHLLRLWLSLDDRTAVGPWLRTLGRLVVQRLQQ